MIVHESVMEIQIRIITSRNWSMDFYQLPIIITNSYPMTSFVELWNPSLYIEKTIYNLTKQIFEFWISHLRTDSSIFHQ